MHNTTIISFPGLSDFSHLCMHLTYTHACQGCSSQSGWLSFNWTPFLLIHGLLGIAN